MSELRKAKGDRPYFITLTVVGWIDVFIRAEYCDEFIKSLEYCRKNKGLRVFAYCIMSSHIHLVVASDENKLSEIIHDIKSYTAKSIISLIKDNPLESRKDWMLHLFRYHAKYKRQNQEYMFWQKTSHPTELFTNQVFDQKVDYIHHNPVKAGMVNDETNFTYSSANPDSLFKVDES